MPRDMMKKSNNNINVGKMEGYDWEMRPGGMLVQKRNLDHTNKNPSNPTPTIKVSIKFGSSYHQIHIDSHASFGELKKVIGGITGLHPQDQKLIFKDKERDSRSFLDVSGVKDGSKMVLIHDIINQEKRVLDSRRNSIMEKALKSVAEVALEVDKLVAQVTAMESVICKGGTVTEKELSNLIEMLMAQLIKLDEIVADGDVKLKRKTQVVRIQKYMENLDRLKVQNMMPIKYGGCNGGGDSGRVCVNGISQQRRPLLMQQQRQQRNYSNEQVNFATKWEKY